MTTLHFAGRRVVVVLGMHNSGTSLVAQIVDTLGARLGPRVLTRASFTVDKPYDYWEHAILTEFHEELLTLIGRHWGTARGAAPIPAAVWGSATVAPFRARMIEVVKEELAATPGAWAFKDPRTPRFLPLWHGIFAELGIEPVYVISTRPAGAVARSFANKAVVTPDWAEALWRRTYLEILAATDGAPRIFIDYDDWFRAAEATTTRLDAFLAAGGDRAAAQGLIDPSKLSDYGRNPRPASGPAQVVEALLRRAAAGEDVAAETAAALAGEDRLAAARSDMELDCAVELGGPRRVAIVTPELAGPFRNGGIGTAFAGLAEALAEAGHAVTVLHAATTDAERQAVEDWAGHAAERGFTLQPLMVPGDAAQSTGAALAAFEAVRDGGWEVIHTADWMALGALLGDAKRQGLAFHNATLVCGTHGNYRWARQANREGLSTWSQLLWDGLERRAVEGADVVISPSRYLMDWMIDAGWALPARSFVQHNIYPGAPAAADDDARFPAPRELVFFGRLEERKGLLLFLDALDLLARRRPLPAVTFLGRSTTVRGRDGAAIVDERAAGRDWRRLELGRDEALAYLRGQDVGGRGRLAVVPSLLENSPFTVLECVVEGIPLLAADVGGVAELVRPEDAAMLFAADAAALADRLAEVLDQGVPRARPRLDPAANRAVWQVWHRRLPAAPGPAAEDPADWVLWREPGAELLPAADRLAQAGATAGAGAAWGVAEDGEGRRWLGVTGPAALRLTRDITGRGVLALSPAALRLLDAQGITADQPHALWRAALALWAAEVQIAAVPLTVARLPALAAVSEPLDAARLELALSLLPPDTATAQDLARLAAAPPPAPVVVTVAPDLAAQEARRAALADSSSWRVTAPLRRLFGGDRPRSAEEMLDSLWWDLAAPLRLAKRVTRLLGR
jgi:glycosyltransferase involved in cell wall biosynthesis